MPERQRHWDGLIESVRREGQAIGGWGSVVVQITYHAGLPSTLEVLERRPKYRFGSELTPLTGGGTIEAIE